MTIIWFMSKYALCFYEENFIELEIAAKLIGSLNTSVI